MARERHPSKAVAAHVKEKPTSTTGKVQHSLTVLWNELQPWQQDNHYIRSGYRPASQSFAKSYASLGYLHNETVNIFSHMIGAIAIALLGVWLYQALHARYESATRADIAAFGTFLANAVLCLGMSSTYHTISNHSLKIARIGNKLDYLGIVLLTSGSAISMLYYGFNCHTEVLEFYWLLVCRCCECRPVLTTIQMATIGLTCSAVCMFDKFRSPAWRPYRAAMFVAEGLTTVIPVLHALTIFSVDELRGRIGLFWLMLEGAFYLLGAGLYAVSLSRGQLNRTKSSRLAGQSAHLQVVTIYGAVRIRFSTCWSISLPQHTSAL